MEKKVAREFIDVGFGFKIRLRNVPMIKVRGAWTPNINYNELTNAVLYALAHKPSRLSGSEVRFIRQHFELTLQAFAGRFSVSHPAVIKWEKMGGKPTVMNWATEKDLRLHVLSKLGANASAVAALYAELEQEASKASNPVEIDGTRVAA